MARRLARRLPGAGRRPDGADLRAAGAGHLGGRLPGLPDGAATAPAQVRADGALVFPPVPGPALRPLPRAALHARRAVRGAGGVRLRDDAGRPGVRLVAARPRPTATSSPRCCARSTTTRSPTPSTSTSPARGWWGSWAVTRWRADGRRTRARRSSAGRWPAPGSRWPPAAAPARWRPRTSARTRPRLRRRDARRGAGRAGQGPVLPPVGVRRGRRRPSPYASAGPAAATRAASRPGSTGTSRRTRSPGTSRSTSRTPPGRTVCWPARTAGVVFLPGAAGTVQEIFDNATPNYYESRGEPTPMVLVDRAHWTERLPAWPLLRRLRPAASMDARIALVDSGGGTDVREAGLSAAGPATLRARAEPRTAAPARSAALPGHRSAASGAAASRGGLRPRRRRVVAAAVPGSRSSSCASIRRP